MRAEIAPKICTAHQLKGGHHAANLRSTKNPEFFGQVVAALRLLAEQRQPQTAVERGLVSALAAQQLTRESAVRMIGTLEAKPGPERSRFLGVNIDPGFRLPEQTMDAAEQPPLQAKTRTTRDHRRGRDHRGIGGGQAAGTSSAGGVSTNNNTAERPSEADPFPDHGPSIVYTLRYVGLFCQDETNGPGSDEIYVITSAIFHDGHGSNVSTATINNPLNHPGGYYGDVDDEETRVGPVVVVWRGNTDTLSLIVVVMEHDEGVPDAWRAEIDKAIKAAIAIATKFWPPAATLTLIQDFIVDAINWLLDTDDDVIATRTEVLTREQIEPFSVSDATYQMGTRKQLMPSFPPRLTTIPLTTPLFRHFSTRHEGDGAD